MGLLKISPKQNVKRPRHGWISSVPGLILIDSFFVPIAFNHEGAAILTYPNQPNMERIDALRIPPEILDGIRRYKLTDSPVMLMPFQAGRREYICHAFSLNFCNTSSAQPIFALILQRSSSADETVDRIAAQFHLTEREREALQGISMGLSSKELAARMRISPNTVKAYLHLVMVKMGVTSRAGIVAKMLEQNSGGSGNLIAADPAREGLEAKVLADLYATGSVARRNRVRR